MQEALFTSMSVDSWHKCTDPKLKGTWNIHNALKGNDAQLDFFLLTSSISGTVGTATESNYCSANAFLDAFARYRQSLGLPAVSIGLGMISEVGYLHEHPEIEALLLRKGLHAIPESELLDILDIVLVKTTPHNKSQGSEHHVKGHVLTGLEAQGLEDIRQKGFEGGSHILDDPRTLLVAQTLSKRSGDNVSSAVEQSHVNRHLPKSISKILAAERTDQTELIRALEYIVGAKIRNLLLLPTEKLSAKTQLSVFGLDSVLAAEFRQFIYRMFEVDVPFMTLLDRTASVEKLSRLVAKDLLSRRSREIV